MPPALHPTKALSSFGGQGVSGCSLKCDLPAAGPEVLGHARGCMGPGQCPPLPPDHHCLAPLHPLPTGPLPHSRPSNFSILCLRKVGSTVTPLPLSHSLQQKRPGQACADRDLPLVHGHMALNTQSQGCGCIPGTSWAIPAFLK